MNKIKIIIDTSGSMKENENLSILKYILQPLKRELKGHYEIYSWSDKIKKKEEESFSLEIIGKSNVEEFKIFLENLENNSVVLLLSDGDFEKMNFLNKKEIKIYSLAIGAVADEINLQNISTNKKVFRAYDTLPLINILKKEII